MQSALLNLSKVKKVWSRVDHWPLSEQELDSPNSPSTAVYHSPNTALFSPTHWQYILMTELLSIRDRKALV